MRIRDLVLASATAVGISAAPAHAVVFNLNDIGGAGQGAQARKGFEIAAAYWSSVLTDDVTVNLNIGFQSLGAGILGQAGSTTGARLVQNAYVDLALDASSALDDQAVTNLTDLTPSATFGGPILALDAITSAYVDPFNRVGVDTGSQIFDNDGSANNVVLDVNTANLKALGVMVDDGGVDIRNLVDAEIVFSSDFRFDFNPTNGISDNSYDFIGVAIHEIGHALGFVSGVDIYDLVGRPGGPLSAPFEAGAFGSADIGDFRVMSMLDLYRYSAAGLDWSVGSEAYLSLDGGVSELFGGSRFSTGAYNGDGRQASHWVDNLYAPRIDPACSNVITAPIGIMNPTSGACEAGFVTGLDLAALDAIGWDLNLDVLGSPGYVFTTAQAHAQAAIPEPATWAMMILGFGAIGALRRRRTVPG